MTVTGAWLVRTSATLLPRRLSTASTAMQRGSDRFWRDGRYIGAVGPAVMRLLGQYGGLQLDKMQASGPFGRILKGDILRYIGEHGLQPTTRSPSAGARVEDAAAEVGKETVAADGTTGAGSRPKFTDRPVTDAAERAQWMHHKLSTPHYYAHTTVRMEGLGDEAVVQRVKKAAEAALRHYPSINGHRRGVVMIDTPTPTSSSSSPAAAASSGGPAASLIIRNWEVLAWDVVRDGVPVVSVARRGDGDVVVGLSVDARVGSGCVGGFLDRVKRAMEGDVGLLV